jgi:hypothetical protein
MQRAWSLVVPPHYSTPVGILNKRHLLATDRMVLSRPSGIGFPGRAGLGYQAHSFSPCTMYEEAYSSICSRKMFAFVSHDSSSSRSPHGFDPYQRLMDDAFHDFGGSVRPVAIVDYLIVSDRKAVGKTCPVSLWIRLTILVILIGTMNFPNSAAIFTRCLG